MGPERAWLKAASTLVFCRGSNNVPKVLLVKRKSSAGFMPNVHVFPGGIVDDQDKSCQWSNAFPKLAEFSLPASAKNPDIYDNEHDEKLSGELGNHAALRVSALRELFEETGLLLLQNSPEFGASQALPLVKCLKADDPRRRAVQLDASKFVSLCQKISSDSISTTQCIPDVFSLMDFSTWLTPIFHPSMERSQRRYDTQFYTIFIGDEVEVHPDTTEVTEAKFWYVSDVFKAFLAREIKLYPPQVYELGRVAEHSTTEELRGHCLKVHQRGTRRIYPIEIELKDVFIRIVPGDPLYPSVPDLCNYSYLKLDLTFEELENALPGKHRSAVKKPQARL